MKKEKPILAKIYLAPHIRLPATKDYYRRLIDNLAAIMLSSGCQEARDESQRRIEYIEDNFLFRGGTND